MQGRNQVQVTSQPTEVEVIEIVSPRRTLWNKLSGCVDTSALREEQFNLAMDQVKAARTHAMLQNTATFAMIEENVSFHSPHGGACCRAIINAYVMESVKSIHRGGGR